MRKKVDATTIKKIAIFDLDGTLVDSPTPDTGKLIYQEKTGKPWPYEGWWSKAESLDASVFDISLNNDVVALYNKVSTEPNTLLVLLTGRIPRLAPQVESILNSYGIYFDLYLYALGGPTEVSKMRSLDRLLVDYPNVKVITSIDDRQSHVPHFTQWGVKNHHIDFTHTLIDTNNPPH